MVGKRLDSCGFLIARDNFPEPSSKFLLTSYWPEFNCMSIPEWLTDKEMALTRPIRLIFGVEINFLP